MYELHNLTNYRRAASLVGVIHSLTRGRGERHAETKIPLIRATRGWGGKVEGGGG